MFTCNISNAQTIPSCSAPAMPAMLKSMATYGDAMMETTIKFTSTSFHIYFITITIGWIQHQIAYAPNNVLQHIIDLTTLLHVKTSGLCIISDSSPTKFIALSSKHLTDKNLSIAHAT